MATNVLRSSSFISGIGVDTHIPYTDGGYANLANVSADLSYLGVSQLRDGISNGQNGSAGLSSFITLAQQGAKFTFVAAGGGAITTASLQAEFSLYDQLAQAVPGSIVAIEGANEINNFPITYNGVGGLQGAINLQQDLYTKVHSDPALAGVSVDYFTGYDAGAIPIGPDPATTAGLADFDTQHPYPNNGDAPAAWVAPSRGLVNENAPYGPFVYTETGYSSNGGTGGGVNADVQGKYTLDLLLDAAKNGASKTDLYQLLDGYQPGSPQGDDGFGLFDPNHVAKPAAIGIHDLTTILADTGANATGFATTPLSFTISGLPSTGNSLAMEKSTGAYDIAVWNEQPIWNEQTGTEIAATSTPITVQLGTVAGTVKIFDPLVSTTAIQTLTNVSSVQLGLSDHPLIVEVEPGAAPPVVVPPPVVVVPPVVTPPVVTPPASNSTITLGSGPDTLALAINEDAYLGNAKFTVSVNGIQIGGTQTATAIKGTGQSQIFNVQGTFSGASNTATVNFLNDAWGGTPATDRNLYVTGATIDGTAIAGAVLNEHGSGPQSFSFQNPGSPVVTPPVTPPPTTTLSTLQVGLSEDAYLGNAMFSATVDGVSQGPAQTVTALHSQGGNEMFNLASIGVGTHDIAISFLNDAWAGTPQTDRNLYVDSISVNGAVVPGTSAAIYGQTTDHFSVVVAK